MNRQYVIVLFHLDKRDRKFMHRESGRIFIAYSVLKMRTLYLRLNLREKNVETRSDILEVSEQIVYGNQYNLRVF